MLRTPAGSVVLVSVATPEEFTVAALPICVAPLKKLTVPTEEPVGVGVMVAVNVSVWPVVTGFGASVSAVAVAAGFTMKIIADEVEVAKLVLPP
jgi:hypothetical protein